jgi:hypothetical protein
MNRLSTTLVAAAIAAAVSAAQAATYNFVVPTEGPKEFLNSVQTEIKGFVENATEGTAIQMLNTDGKVLCSLTVQHQSPGNWPRLMKNQCAKLKMTLQIGNRNANEVPAKIPKTVAAVLQNVAVAADDHLIVFDNPLFRDARERLDLSIGYPSMGHTTELAYGLSSFSTYQVPKAQNAYLHVIYPSSVNFLNLTHETKISNLYQVWSDQMGMKLASFQPITSGIAKLNNPALLKNLPPAKPDASMGAVYFVDLTKTAAAKVVKRAKPFWEDLLSNNNSVTTGDTLPRYQFDLVAPAVLKTLELVEADADFDGSNLVKIDAIDSDGNLVPLQKVTPSLNNEVKTHKFEVPLNKTIRSVVIMPIKDGKPDALGGWWQIVKLQVEHL